MALDALDQSISAVLGSDQFQNYKQFKPLQTSQEVRSSTHFITRNQYFIHSRIYNVPRLNGMQKEADLDKLMSLECSVISPLKALYFSTQSVDVRLGSLKILLHVLEVLLLLTGHFCFHFYFLILNFFK